LGVRSNSTPINSKNLLTEPIGPHYMKLENLDFETLILNSIELLWCLNHVVTRTLRIRYTGCYSPPSLKQNPIPRFERRKVLTQTTNSRTFPHCGSSKFGWRDRRKSSLFQVASSSVWLLHCTFENLMVLCRVTRSF
jgi:hypothetical protein